MYRIHTPYHGARAKVRRYNLVPTESKKLDRVADTRHHNYKKMLDTSSNMPLHKWSIHA